MKIAIFMVLAILFLMITLEVEKRDSKTKRTVLRKKGFMPAVFYGRKEASTPISVSEKDFYKVWKKAGESSIIKLQPKTGEELEALIQDVDLDPVTGVPRHADFYVIEKGKKLQIKVPLEFTGVSIAVKDLGGILVKVMHELTIEALPKDLPHGITIDIAPLVDFKSQILAKQVKLPSGVELVVNPEEVVALVSEPKIEEEKPPETIDLSTIEVEKKGKEAKEGEEGAEGAVEGGAPAGAKEKAGKDAKDKASK